MKQRYGTIDAMPRQPVHDDALRERLMTVTADLVDRHGAEGASLRAIAQAAGTSTSAVYTLFGSRELLLGAVIDGAFQSFFEAQAAAEPRGLRALGEAYRAWALEHPPLYRLMFTTALADTALPASPSSEEAMSPLQRLVAARFPDATADEQGVLTLAIWSQVHGAVALELTGMPMPDGVWSAVYLSILDQIERAHPVPTR